MQISLPFVVGLAEISEGELRPLVLPAQLWTPKSPFDAIHSRVEWCWTVSAVV